MESKECATKIRELSKELYGSIKKDADIYTLAETFDEKIFGLGNDFFLLTPTTIDMNQFVNNCSPTASYKIQETDLISYSLSLGQKISKKKSINLKMALTRTINPTFQNVVDGTADACKAALGECGVDVRLTDIRLSVIEVLDSYELHGIKNACGHELNNLMKIVPNTNEIPKELRDNFTLLNSKMKEGETYFIDVYGTDTSTDVLAKRFHVQSIFYGTGTKICPKRKSTQEAKQLIEREYKENLFSFRDFNKRWHKKSGHELNKSLLGDLYKHQVIFPIECTYIENEHKDYYNTVARFGHSIYIDEGKNTILC